MQQASVFPLTLMEAGFKIIPGKEGEFFEAQNRMIPVGMAQPGFVSVYGGPIADSTWLYFGVRFSSPEEMGAWHAKPGHRAIQRTAYEKWWTAMYIRKWQRPGGDAFVGDRFFCETRIERDRPMSDEELRFLKTELKSLAEFGVKRFETHSGQYDPQPYQLVGPLEVAPASAPVSYALLTHWASHAAVSRWQDSSTYRAICQFGAVVTDTFVSLAEDGKRNHLREDKLQRDWALVPSPSDLARKTSDETYQEHSMSKVWLITGSASGMGRHIADAVLASGNRLVATCRSSRRKSRPSIPDLPPSFW